MTGTGRTWRLLDRPALDLDAAERRLRRAIEQQDAYRWEFEDDGGATCQNWRTGQTYHIDPVDGCSCPDRIYRGVTCKHMVAAALIRLERGL